MRIYQVLIITNAPQIEYIVVRSPWSVFLCDMEGYGFYHSTFHIIHLYVRKPM